MLNRLFVKPTPQPEGAAALQVRKPTGGHLAEAGEFVPDESYWRRRLADGDVVEAEAPAEAQPADLAATSKKTR